MSGLDSPVPMASHHVGYARIVSVRNLWIGGVREDKMAN